MHESSLDSQKKCVNSEFSIDRWSLQRCTSARIEMVKAIEAMAKEKNITSSQLALAWIINKGFLPIPGTKRKKYLEQNIAATEIELNEQDLSKLESIVPLGTDTGKPYDEFSMGLID